MAVKSGRMQVSAPLRHSLICYCCLKVHWLLRPVVAVSGRQMSSSTVTTGKPRSTTAVARFSDGRHFCVSELEFCIKLEIASCDRCVDSLGMVRFFDKVCR